MRSCQVRLEIIKVKARRSERVFHVVCNGSLDGVHIYKPRTRTPQGKTAHMSRCLPFTTYGCARVDSAHTRRCARHECWHKNKEQDACTAPPVPLLCRRHVPDARYALIKLHSFSFCSAVRAGRRDVTLPFSPVARGSSAAGVRSRGKASVMEEKEAVRLRALKGACIDMAKRETTAVVTRSRRCGAGR